jgi:exonuclease 3'-5' domain-containing protein 1
MDSLNIVMVSTTQALQGCLAAILPTPWPKSPVNIAVDIEGVDLSRKGRISIIQLFVRDGDTVWLIDVTTLGKLAFDEVDSEGRSLRGILQGTAVKKVRDVRPSSRVIL